MKENTKMSQLEYLESQEQKLKEAIKTDDEHGWDNYTNIALLKQLKEFKKIIKNENIK